MPPRPARSSPLAWLEALPLALPALLAGFSLVAMVLLQVGHYRPLLVLPFGLAAGVAAARAVGLTRPEPLRGPRALDAAALALAAAAALLNLRYGAENIVVFRDPAVYAVTGEWLAHHGSLPIPVHAEVFGRVDGVSFASAAFDQVTTPGFVQSQFSNLLPGLLAVGGWLGGDAALLRVNPMLAGAALLGFYGIARQYVGRAWALVPVAVLAVSAPMLHFSRNAYSEPVTMLFLLGGLALLREAQRRGRPGGYALAGLVLGSAVLARVDGFFYLLAVLMVVAATLAAAPPGRRREAAALTGALVGGVAAPALVAVANLVNLSADYLHNLRGELRTIAAAAVVIGVAGVAAVLLAWRTRLLHRAAAATGGWLAPAAAGSVVALAAVGASRPLWYVGRTPGAPESQTHYVEFLQKANRLPLDGTRSYAEQTISWLSWYWGPVTVALAVAGVALGVHRLVRRGDLRLVAPLGMFLSAALLYLSVPSIVPDQVWAMRRYLPVVVPGFLLAAVVVCALVGRRGRAGRLVAAVLAASMFVVPLFVSHRLVGARDGTPQLAEVHNLCAALPADAALVVVGELVSGYQQTARSYCDGVAVAGLRDPDRATLGAVAAAAQAHGRRLFVLGTSAGKVADDAAPAGGWPPISCVAVSHWNATLNRAVDTNGVDNRRMLLGAVGADGMVVPAPPAGPPLLSCVRAPARPR